jgi:hypothetical protein
MADCPRAEADPANNAIGSPKCAVRNDLNLKLFSFMFLLLDLVFLMETANTSTSLSKALQ